MIRPLRSLVATLAAAGLLVIPSARCGMAATVALPDPTLTPGIIYTNVTAAQICQPGYASGVRNVSSQVKRQVYVEYGITHHRSGQYEIDHLVPLELGGSNNIRNLWPQPSTYPGFHQKDHLETYLHDRVCSGQETLRQVQHDIAVNWYQVWVAAGQP